MDKKYVSTGKPAVGGAVFHGPLTATLPTDATTAIATVSADYADLGYCSEEGLKAVGETTTQDIKEWGGQVVDSAETEKTDKYEITFIESNNPEVLKLVHGSSNVSGTLEDGIHVTVNATEHDYERFIVDMIMKGAVKRIVIPQGKVTNVAEVVYKRDEAVGYKCTITAYPYNTNGDTHEEYIKATTS